MLISHEIKKSKKPIVMCSWGKDSMTMLHLIRKVCENVMVVFSNTNVEYPETYKFRDRMLKEWNIKNYTELKPIKNFWECVKKYGLPKLKSNGKHVMCCYYMKEKPAQKFIKKEGVDCEFVGMRAAESMRRRLTFLKNGESFYSKWFGCQSVRPLMIWTEEDILTYTKINKIPMNSLYKIMPRTGCMPCTSYTNWREIMKKASPKVFEIINKIDEKEQIIKGAFCK